MGQHDWVFPVKEAKVQSYMAKAARNVSDHTVVLLCGSNMPCIELQRGHKKTVVNPGRQLYHFLCVLPDPTEAAGYEFTDPKLQ